MKKSNLLVFAKKDKKPTGDPATQVLQEDLELWLIRRREFAQQDELIALALAYGSPVEEGLYTAELMTANSEDGRTHLKVVVR